MGIRTKSWEWEEMSTRKSFPHISTADAYDHCADYLDLTQLRYTIQHRTVLTIFPLIKHFCCLKLSFL